MRQLTSISNLANRNQFLPTTEDNVDDLAAKQWITVGEATMLREIITLQRQLQNNKDQLEQQYQIQNGVASSQERLRKNISTLSVDGLKSNPVLLRYIENLGKEEEKYLESKALEDKLNADIKEGGASISKKISVALTAMSERIFAN